MSRGAILGLLLLPAPAGVALLSLAAEPAPALDPQLPYQAQRTHAVTYKVDFAVIVTAPSHTKQLKVWLPLPQTDAGQEVQPGTISTFPVTVKPRIAREPVFGNQFAYFEFDHPEGAQIIRHEFSIKVWELHWDVDPAKVQTVAHWPESFAPYLRSDQSVVVNDPLRQLTRSITPERKGPARDLGAVMDWVSANIKYDHASASLQASSEHARKNHCGHCSDYHGLCAAMGRSLGFATRVVYGINPFPKNSPSHCKLEAYLPPYGWVSFDVSETQRLLTAIRKEPKLDDAKRQQLIAAATQRLRRGFRDNTWYAQTRGTDYDLAPPARQRVPVVRTIYAEADGIALPDPDPANPQQRTFAWMTAHKYTPDRSVSYPFTDLKSLAATVRER